MKREVISTENAPAAGGPYSQGIRIGDFLFVSGQIPIDPKTGVPIKGDVKVQTAQALKNVSSVLQATGASLEDIVKATVFVTHMDEYDSINEVYGQFFNKGCPARSCLEVSRLPKNVGVEIEVIAVMKSLVA